MRSDRELPPVDTYYELGRAGPDGVGDQLLYHYTRADVALQHILPSRKLRLSAFRAMRDPLENKELPRLLRLTGGRTSDGPSLEVVQERLTELRAQMRILSLTMDATGYEDDGIRVFGRGYARPRMWEHYAEQHRGVCLAFSSGCLVGPFFDHLGAYGAAACGPVQYTPGGFAVSQARLLDADGLTHETIADVLTAHVTRHHHDFWFLKLFDWETEFEYRFVLFSPPAPLDEPIDVSFDPCLRAVILGERFDADLVGTARDLAEQFRVPLVRLEWDSGRPSAVRVPPDPS